MKKVLVFLLVCAFAPLAMAAGDYNAGNNRDWSLTIGSGSYPDSKITDSTGESVNFDMGDGLNVDWHLYFTENIGMGLGYSSSYQETKVPTGKYTSC
ncbi:hypothetical protein RsTz2092_00550 [Deferribacterales bacterium RsTz2092]|nr:hypothetical protein AGMMS49941_01160 [Deferribacterales bacterium]